MGGMQPGDKLTAQNLNDAYMCRTDDTDSTGRIKTDRYYVEGKRDEVAADAQTLVADVGVILITAPGAPTGAEGATTLSPDPTQGAENGQRISIINCSGGNYGLDFLSDPITLPDGAGVSLYYCSTKGGWLPIGAADSGNCKTIDVAPPAGLVAGNHVYYDGAAWQIGDVATVAELGIFYVVETSAASFKIQASGFVEAPAHGFTVGDYYYLDAAGAYTNVLPSNIGDIQKDAFYVVDANCLHLLLENPYSIVSGPAGARLLTGAKMPADQVIASNAFNDIALSSTFLDTGSFADLPNNQFVIPAGTPTKIYVLRAMFDVRFSVNGANDYIAARAFVNGVEPTPIRRAMDVGTQNVAGVIRAATYLDVHLELSAGDTVKAQIFGNAASGTITVNSGLTWVTLEEF